MHTICHGISKPGKAGKRELYAKHLSATCPRRLSGAKSRRTQKPFPPEYTALTASYVRQILQDDHSLIPQLFRREAVETLLADPDAMPEPWYGQLMRGPQVFAYLIQLDRWFKKYHIRLV